MAARILLIDDDEEMCEEVSEILRDEGYEVDVANDGTAGEAQARQRQYQVVLLDLKMPGYNGREVLKRIRAAGIQVTVFVLTGSPLGGNPLTVDEMQISKDDELFSLADGVLNKPFDIEEVLRKVEDAVNNSHFSS